MMAKKDTLTGIIFIAGSLLLLALVSYLALFVFDLFGAVTAVHASEGAAASGVHAIGTADITDITPIVAGYSFRPLSKRNLAWFYRMDIADIASVSGIFTDADKNIIIYTAYERAMAGSFLNSIKNGFNSFNNKGLIWTEKKIAGKKVLHAPARIDDQHGGVIGAELYIWSVGDEFTASAVTFGQDATDVVKGSAGKEAVFYGTV